MHTRVLSPSAKQPFRRYHALDAVRASMMLLGLVIHSAASYTSTPLGADWSYQDTRTSAIFDFTVFCIHLFRMPVFFVVAGFFAALLYARDGASRFAVNRARRVLLPLVIFWIPLFPLVVAGFTFALGRAAGAVDWTPLLSGAFLQDASLIHLWFLWHLVIFYAATLLLVPLASRLPPSWQQAADRAFVRVATSAWGLCALSGVTMLTLLPMEKPSIETSIAFVPPLRVLAAYGVFYVFGWLLFRSRNDIEPFASRWKTPMAWGAIASVLYLVVTVGAPISDPDIFHLVAVAVAAMAMWLLVFGMLGAFVFRMHQPRPMVRYLSDAAYWMYLVHLPLAIWITGALALADLPAVVKWAVVLSVTTAVTVGTYHFFVRTTAVGALLNGRRYPRRATAAQISQPGPSRVV